MAETESNRGREGLTVYVDDQPVTVEEEELTIRRLLELAGSPTDTGQDGEAVLRELRGEQEIEHNDLEATIRVSDEARFYTRNASSGSDEDVEAREPQSFRSESANLETGTSPKGGGVNASSFGPAGAGGQARSEVPGRSSTGPSGSTPNLSREQQRSPNVGGQQTQASGPNVGGRLPTPETATQRGSTSGSNVASGTGVRRDTESPNRGTIPGQGVQNPKIGGQQGSSIQGSKSAQSGEQTRQGFNEGQSAGQGSRRSGERPEGRPGERKKEEPQS
jgi:hypothetical protein